MPEANKNEAREQRLLDAASELIVHYGYGKTTIDDIAAQAGVSKGAVYLHFRSKDDLLDQLLLRESERMLNDMLARMDADPQGVTLFNIYRYAMVSLTANPLLRAIYVQDKRILGDYMRRMQDTPLFQQAMQFGVEFVEHFQRIGLVKPDVDAATLSYILLSLRYGVLMMDSTPAIATTSIEAVGEMIGTMLQTSFGTDASNDAEAKAAMLTLIEQGIGLFKQMREMRA